MKKGFRTTLQTLYEACQQQPEDQDDLFFTSFTSTRLMRCTITLLLLYSYTRQLSMLEGS